MINTLADLPIKVKEHRMYEIAVEIVKLQNFKTNAAIKRLSLNLSDSTKRNYLENGIKYIQTGKMHTNYMFLKKHIDKAIEEHVQPLTPSKENKRRIFKTTQGKKEFIPPVAKLEIINKSLVAKFEYGIRFGNEIKLFNSKDEAKGFIQGVKYAGVFTGKLVEVEINEVEND